MLLHFPALDVDLLLELAKRHVKGRVDGDIFATESVSIRQSAKVKGNIYAPRVGIADGANFSGSVDMNHKGAAATARPATVQVALSDPAAERLLTKAMG